MIFSNVDSEQKGHRSMFVGTLLFDSEQKGRRSSAANLDLYDLDLDLWQGSLDRKKSI